MEDKTIRLFVAVELPQALKEYLQPLMQKYEQPEVRLVPKENLHLTLFFIGNTKAEQLEKLQQQLAEIAVTSVPFILDLKAITPGPSASKPRLVWAQFNNNSAFTELSKRLQQALAPEVGLPKEAIPHITLGRMRKDMLPPRHLPVITPDAPVQLHVKELSLWKSELGQPHPRYSILQTFSFGRS